MDFLIPPSTPADRGGTIRDLEEDLADDVADEVLAVDVGQCAAQYVLSAYGTADPGERPDAVHDTIRAAGDPGLFWSRSRSASRA